MTKKRKKRGGGTGLERSSSSSAVNKENVQSGNGVPRVAQSPRMQRRNVPAADHEVSKCSQKSTAGSPVDKKLSGNREKARNCAVPTALLLEELLRLHEPTRPPPNGSSLLRLLLKEGGDAGVDDHGDSIADEQDSACRLYVHLVWRVLYLASHDANPRESASSAAFLVGVAAYMAWGVTPDQVSEILQWRVS